MLCALGLHAGVPPTPTVQGFRWTLRGTDAETSPFGAPRAASQGVGRHEELPDLTGENPEALPARWGQRVLFLL